MIKKKEEEPLMEDENDIKRHMLEIHSKSISSVLSKDLVLASLDDKERTFITNNIEAAHEAIHMIKDVKQAQYASQRLLLRAFCVALLKRNVKENPLIERMLNKGQQELMQEPTMDDKIIEKLKREKQ